VTNTDRISEQIEVYPAPAEVRKWCFCAILRRVHAGPVQARVQASTWASLNIIVDGEVHSSAGVLPRRFLTAPFAVPFDTRTPGPLLSLSLVLQPWALQGLTGMAAAALGPSPVDVAHLGCEPLEVICAAMAEACRSADMRVLWAALQAQAHRVPAGPPALAWHMLCAHGVGAAATALGWSPRHYLRQFRHAMGLPPATWIRIRRWEAALQALAAGDEPSIAQLSLRHGFADQAHLARDARALVDQTPVRLRQLLRHGRVPWSLRPAHVRFVQDEDETRA
jgi:AraC-like DNA-binding protein